MINDTDTGFSEDDRLTQNSRPEVIFNSESGLRVFIEFVPLTGSNVLLTLDEDFSFTDTEGEYSITFLKDLSNGSYRVITEDDAGNRNLVSNEQTFVIDKEKPDLSSINLIDDEINIQTPSGNLNFEILEVKHI